MTDRTDGCDASGTAKPAQLLRNASADDDCGQSVHSVEASGDSQVGRRAPESHSVTVRTAISSASAQTITRPEVRCSADWDTVSGRREARSSIQLRPWPPSFQSVSSAPNLKSVPFRSKIKIQACRSLPRIFGNFFSLVFSPSRATIFTVCDGCSCLGNGSDASAAK